MKPLPLLLLLSLPLQAEEPKAAATPAPKAQATPAPKTFFVLPSQRQPTPQEAAEMQAILDKRAKEADEAIAARRQAEALERIARALESKK